MRGQEWEVGLAGPGRNEGWHCHLYTNHCQQAQKLFLGLTLGHLARAPWRRAGVDCQNFTKLVLRALPSHMAPPLENNSWSLTITLLDRFSKTHPALPCLWAFAHAVPMPTISPPFLCTRLLCRLQSPAQLSSSHGGLHHIGCIHSH